uniref:Uncharacterized protein n=1 Tax=Cannabis sativa TaxID=3483 RepID=A0A803PU76_CANSA
MAKKKASQQPKVPRQEALVQSDHRAEQMSDATPIPPMAAVDDFPDKLQSLKSLNSRLLKETFERRQQMESLVQDKEALESELARSGLEKNALESELTRVSEESLGLELEKGVFRAFLNAQVAEMGVVFDGLVREKIVEVGRVKSENEVEIRSLKSEVNKLVDSLQSERSEVKRVCLERDDLRKDFDVLVQEATLLKKKVVDTENRERLMKEEVEKLKIQCEGLMEGRVEREAALEVLKKEKDLAERKLGVSQKLIVEFRSENERILSEKNDIEREKNGLERQIGVLEKEVEQRNDTVSNLKREVAAMEASILESERFNRESVNGMEAEIKSLKEETKVKEQDIKKLQSQLYEVELTLKMATIEVDDKQRMIEELTEKKTQIEDAFRNQEDEIVKLNKEVGELRDALFSLRTSYSNQEEENNQLLSELSNSKDAIGHVEMELKSLKEEKESNIRKLQSQLHEAEVALNMTTMEVKHKQRNIDELAEQKYQIEEEFANQGNEIVKLHKEMGELKDALLELRTSCRDREERNKQLLSEVSNNKDALHNLTLQKNEAQNAFDGEKKIVENLKLVISEREKRIEEVTKESQALSDEHEKLMKKTKETEKQLGLLVKERDAAQNSLLEVQTKMEEWKAKVEFAGINSERALTLLKKTAAMVSVTQSEEGSKDGKKDVVIRQRKLEGEAQPYVTELEAIQNAFRNKEKMVEDMKQQVEHLKRSTAEARKQKSIWTLITSATIFAAASFAYAAKGR